MSSAPASVSAAVCPVGSLMAALAAAEAIASADSSEDGFRMIGLPDRGKIKMLVC